MIDEKIIELLSKRHGTYDFNKLIEFIESTGFVYKAKTIKYRPIAIATIDCVYLDLNKLDYFGDKLTYFIILHETCHMKRLLKFGYEWYLNILSETDFKDLLNNLVSEEILADRYASAIFYKFNKVVYPWNQTQELNLQHKQLQYAPSVNLYFGKIQNDINKYNELISEFIE